MQSIIITGGAGFIGSNFVRLALSKSSDRVVVVDKLTYAGNLASLKDVASHPRFVLVEADIADATSMKSLLKEHNPAALINFAAETHVDRSIDGPHAFINTNIMGTFVLLEAVRKHIAARNEKETNDFRFLHVSTDEVYGSLGKTGAFTEDSPYLPNSPYSASKASADHLVRAYFETYKLPVLITNCSNNYGPYQFPEKLIPLMILNAISAQALPIYGDGGNVRDWLYVEDHCEAIWAVLKKGRCGEKYNIGAQCEKTNVQIVDRLCAILDDLMPAKGNPAMREKSKSSYKELKTFVPDRPGHDRRYAMDSSKIQKELGWKPKFSFEQALVKTVDWYLGNKDWCDAVQSGKYRRERLGLKT